MNDGDQALSFVYLIGILVLVGSGLMVRRIPFGLGVKMFGAWVLIFGAAFIAFTLKDDFADLGRRVMTEVRGEPHIVETGETVRIALADDGHFWATARINGERVRLMVDSGATITSISARTAQRVGIDADARMPAMVRTANGNVMVRRGRAAQVTLGSIERSDLAVHVFDGPGDVNVLGMNFLSSLSSWGVEGRWLVLKP